MKIRITAIVICSLVLISGVFIIYWEYDGSQESASSTKSSLLSDSNDAVQVEGLDVDGKSLEVVSDVNGAKNSEDKERREAIHNAIREWQAIYGDVDFSTKPLFNTMTYIHPKPREDILPFWGVKLKENLKEKHRFWVNQLFEGDFNEMALGYPPVGYYLSESQNEPSYLLYEIMQNDNKITIIENGDLFLLSVEPDTYDQSVGVTEDFLIEFINKNLRLGESARGAISNISFQKHMPEGFVFFSENAGDFLNYPRWEDQIVGFVGKRGVNIILFKTLARKSSRIQVKYDFDWLNNGLVRN